MLPCAETGLSPLAKGGDPRAAMELLRRGRSVIFMPDAGAASYVDAGKFADLLRTLRHDE